MSTRKHLTDRIEAEDVAHIKILCASGLTHTEVARRYALSGGSVGRIIDPDKWTKKQFLVWASSLNNDSPPQDEANPDPGDWQGLMHGTETTESPAEPPVKMGLLAQARLFDKVRTDLHDGLEALPTKGAFFNEMIDELLDELSSWKPA